MQKRVVITGIGILAANGKGRQEFWAALREGRHGIRPISLFDPSEFLVQQAAEVPDFDPKVYMGSKGLRTLDRATMLLVSAAKLAKEDAGLEITEDNTNDIGVSVGTTFGSLKSIVDFDTVVLREGPRAVNPALFPNTVINSPASQVCIWHNIKGFTTTISTGFTASMDAIKYAYDFLQYERAKVIFAGGVEELCYPTFLGFHVNKYLSGSREGDSFVSCPFDRRRNGIVLGEGACFLVLEELEHARGRGARILGEIGSFGYCFEPFRLGKFNPRGTALKKAIQDCLENAGMNTQDVDFICANANSSHAADKVEARVIQEVFGEDRKKIPTSSVKSMVGEGYSVSGVFGVAAALSAIQDNFIFPTVGYEEPDPKIDLNVVGPKSLSTAVHNALVINFGPSSSNEAMVLRRFKE